MLLTLVASQPIWLKFLSIFFGTFILEDATTVIAALAADKGIVSQTNALAALYLGIFLGDLLLYFLGMQVTKWHWLTRCLRLTKLSNNDWSWKRVWILVFIARFTIGTRAPIYTTCGFCKIPFLAFASSCFFATLLWTSILFNISYSCGEYLLAHRDYWHKIALIGFVIGISMASFIIGKLRDNDSNSQRDDHVV